MVARAGERLGLGLDATVVALAGPTGAGKSTLFNVLAGRELSRSGVRRPTTATTTAAVGGGVDDALLDWLDVRSRHALDAGAPAGLVLLDLPDFDSIEAAHRAEVDRLVRMVDLLVWVVDPQKYADAALHEGYLQPLAGHAAAMLVVLNQVDLLAGQGDRAREDLRRVLGDHGLGDVPVLALSARTGEGTDAAARRGRGARPRPAGRAGAPGGRRRRRRRAAARGRGRGSRRRHRPARPRAARRRAGGRRRAARRRARRRTRPPAPRGARRGRAVDGVAAAPAARPAAAARDRPRAAGAGAHLAAAGHARAARPGRLGAAHARPRRPRPACRSRGPRWPAARRRRTSPSSRTGWIGRWRAPTCGWPGPRWWSAAHCAAAGARRGHARRRAVAGRPRGARATCSSATPSRRRTCAASPSPPRSSPAGCWPGSCWRRSRGSSTASARAAAPAAPAGHWTSASSRSPTSS